MALDRVPLDTAVDQFARLYPECQDQAQVRDQCFWYARIFTQYVQEVTTCPAELITGFEMDGNVILNGHTATLVGEMVYDWTLRQFDPHAAVPSITPLAQWRETWRTL